MKNHYINRLKVLFLIGLFSGVSLAAVADDAQENPSSEPVENLSPAPSAEKEATELSASIDRDWGLLLGDELTVVVDTSTLDDTINESSLPQFGTRSGLWLYLKNIDVEAERMLFNYQVVNVPKQSTSAESLSFEVKTNNDQWVIVPAVPFMISPAIASNDGISSIKLKSDIVPIAIATDKLSSKLKYYSIIALVSWLGLALWYFGWNKKNRPPFAQASHDLARLKWKRSASSDEASRILHTGFNKTADTIVVYGEIDNLIEQHSWLAPLQEDIRSFYQESESHFFARESGKEPDLERIKKLAKACRAKEMLA